MFDSHTEQPAAGGQKVAAGGSLSQGLVILCLFVIGIWGVWVRWCVVLRVWVGDDEGLKGTSAQKLGAYLNQLHANIPMQE